MIWSPRRLSKGGTADEKGYIILNNGRANTSLKGVFAAGDCADPVYRQAIHAAGMGCAAAMDAIKYLEEK